MRQTLFSRENIRAGAWVLLAFPICALFFLWLFWRDIGHRQIDHAAMEQKAQFHSMRAAIELFHVEFAAYPSSDANDATGQPYCGAMKLAEALMGQDLLGFHLDSAFRADGLDPNTHLALYPGEPSPENLKARRGPYLPAPNANAFRLVDIYGKGNTGALPENAVVLCDVYERMRPSGRKTGMPILYYRLNLSGTTHDVDSPDNPQNICSHKDNQALVSLGVPGDPDAMHPLADPRRFYLNTRNDKITTVSRPFRSDSYILISAGEDGLYGTADDVCNFAWKYHER